MGLLKKLKSTPNFIGVYAEDQLQTLAITTFPSFLIINLDPSHMQGSHWLALRISRTSLEIFDSLGFQILSWPRIPCNLLKFLRRWSSHRETFISPVIQSQNSVLCGFFCLAFIFCRQIISFKKFLKIFKAPERNDRLLKKLFSYFLNLTYFRCMRFRLKTMSLTLKLRKSTTRVRTTARFWNLFCLKIPIYFFKRTKSLFVVVFKWIKTMLLRMVSPRNYFQC